MFGRRRRIARLCFFTLSLLASLSLLARAQADTIRLEGDVWAPYVMDPAGGRKGFLVDIAEAVFARAGHQVVFSAVPWSRSLMETENGYVDGVVGIYFSQAREKGFVVPDEEIGISVNKLFVRRDSTWIYTGPQSLESMTLGVIADYDYGELNPYIEKLKNARSKSLQINSGNDALQKNMRMLQAGRITVFAEDAAVAGFVARQAGFADQFKPAGVIPPSNRVGIAFSPKNPRAEEFARILSSGIRKMRASGELKSLIDKYEVADWATN